MSQSVWREWQDGAGRRWQLISSPFLARRGGASWEGGSDEAASAGSRARRTRMGLSQASGPLAWTRTIGGAEGLPGPLSPVCRQFPLHEGAVDTELAQATAWDIQWGWWVRWSWLGLPPPAWASAGTWLSGLSSPVGAGPGLLPGSGGVRDTQEAPACRCP